MLNLAPPKNAPTEQRPWNSYKLLPGELARTVVAQPLSEILEYFQNELGDKYVEFKASAKS